ncbi:lysostaphin resistance A-like protein [Clostridium sp. DL1XJH146]
MKKVFGLVWETIKYLFIYYAVSTSILMVASIALLMDRNISEESFNQLLFNYNMNLTPIIALVTFVLFYLIFKAKGQNLVKYCKFNKITLNESILIIVVTLGISIILLCLVQFGISIFPEYSGISDSYEGAMTSIFGVIGIILFAPFIEEVMLRGIIFNKYKEKMNIYLAIILQAMVFGLIHGNSLQTIYTFILAIVLAIVYLWTDSIVATILIHIFYNLFGTLVLPGLLSYMQIDMIFVLAIGIIIFAISMVYLRKITLERY